MQLIQQLQHGGVVRGPCTCMGEDKRVGGRREESAGAGLERAEAAPAAAKGQHTTAAALQASQAAAEIAPVMVQRVPKASRAWAFGSNATSAEYRCAAAGFSSCCIM